MLPSFETAKELFDSYGMNVSRETFDKLEQYAVFLVDYNENVNLTASPAYRLLCSVPTCESRCGTV